MGTVFGKNITSSSITVAGHKVYYIDGTNAEIVEVQDGNNVKYNAFKYLLSGTSYWYVIDGDHDTWTDDLNEWGYSEVPVGQVLPMVTSLAKNYGLSTHATSVPSDGITQAIKAWDGSDFYGDGIEYDSTYHYAIIKYGDGNGGWKPPVNIFDVAWVQSGISSLLMALKNVSSISQNFFSARVAICSSNQATVVTVNNALDVAYNAFKYTTNNTDYYYVLDDIQTNWTDNLAGIGYSLTPQVKVAYMTSSGASAASNTAIAPSMMYHTSHVIYDSLGSEILFDNTKVYTFSAAYNKSGDLVSFGGTPEIGQYMSSGYLGFGVWGNGGTSSVFRIEYIES